MALHSTLIRGLVRSFGGLVHALPEYYQPAGQAFLYSLQNQVIDSERAVPEEILETIAMAVLNSINNKLAKLEETPYPNLSEAIRLLDKSKYAVPVTVFDYPRIYGSFILPGYENHPHYYVMGGFTATPVGKGKWLIEDRYDWHCPDYWRLPECVTSKVPNWVLKKFCYQVEDAEGWYIREVETLAEYYKPYWHRSVVKLSAYLDSRDFE